MDDAHAHQRRKTDRRARIVGEREERAAIRNDAAVQRHAVHRRRHAVLADAVAHIAPDRRFSGVKVPRALRQRVVGAGEIGRAAEQFGARSRTSRRSPRPRTRASPARASSAAIFAACMPSAAMAASTLPPLIAAANASLRSADAFRRAGPCFARAGAARCRSCAKRATNVARALRTAHTSIRAQAFAPASLFGAERFAVR